MKSNKNVGKPFSAILFTILIVLSVLLALSTCASAASDDEIEQAIEDGLAWLASEQGGDGSWDGGGGERDIGATGLALLKFIEYAKENGMNPTQPEYIYSGNVINGTAFLNTTLVNHPVGGGYDGNSNGNMTSLGMWMLTYNTGIGAMTYAANPNTPPDLVQDLTDWLVNAQCTDNTSTYYGVWEYNGFSCWGDNSNTGYAALGLGYALSSGATIPDSTKTALSAYVDYIQNDPGAADDGSEDDPDGGSGYFMPDDWVNSLKTGSLIYEAVLSGDNTDSQRILNATDYLYRHWNDDVEGWMGNMSAPTPYNTQYQATYSIMKGLESIGMDDLNGTDWFDNMSTVLVNDQNVNGSWNNGPNYVMSGGWASIATDDLCTTWALLTLEKVVEVPIIEVYLDVKPGSCPNPINPGKKGVTPVAIPGTEDFDVMTIDPATVELTLEGMDVGVPPLRWSYEDVATPFEPFDDECCHDLDGDGFMDLTLKFDSTELVSTLELEDHAGMTIQLRVVGNLKEEFGGTPIMGEDCVWILE